MGWYEFFSGGTTKQAPVKRGLLSSLFGRQPQSTPGSPKKSHRSHLFTWGTGGEPTGTRVRSGNIGDVCTDCGGYADGAYEPPGKRRLPMCGPCCVPRSQRDYHHNLGLEAFYRYR